MHRTPENCIDITVWILTVQNYTTNQSNKWKEKKGLTLVYPHHRADIFSNWNCFLYAWLLKQNKKGYLPFDIPFGFDPWSVQLYLECVGGKLTLLGRFGDSLEPIKNWQKERKKRLTGHACIHYSFECYETMDNIENYTMGFCTVTYSM